MLLGMLVSLYTQPWQLSSLRRIQFHIEKIFAIYFNNYKCFLNLTFVIIDVKRAIIMPLVYQGRRQAGNYFALGLPSSDMLYKMSDKFNDDY